MDILDTTGVCEFFGISRNTVTTWVRQGKLPAPFSRGRKGNVWFKESIEKAGAYLRDDLEKNMTYFKRSHRPKPAVSQASV